MRRVGLVAAALLTAAAATFTLATNGPTVPGSRAMLGTVADGLGWAAGAPSPTYANTCAPAQAAACDKITQAVVGMLTTAVVWEVVDFITPAN